RDALGVQDGALREVGSSAPVVELEDNSPLAVGQLPDRLRPAGAAGHEDGVNGVVDPGARRLRWSGRLGTPGDRGDKDEDDGTSDQRQRSHDDLRDTGWRVSSSAVSGYSLPRGNGNIGSTWSGGLPADYSGQRDSLSRISTSTRCPSFSGVDSAKAIL